MKKYIILFVIFILIAITGGSYFYFVKNREQIIVKVPPLSNISNSDSVAIYFDDEFIKELKKSNLYVSDSTLKLDINFIEKSIGIPKNSTLPSILLLIDKMLSNTKFSIVNTEVSQYEDKMIVSIGYKGILCNVLNINTNSETLKNINLAIVVKDFGMYDVKDEIDFLRLPIKLNIAINPYYERSNLIMEEADSSMHEVLLNMPMEPKNFNKSTSNPISQYILQYGILARYSKNEIDKKLYYAYDYFKDKKIQPKGMTHLRGFKILRAKEMSKQVTDYCSYKDNYFLYSGEESYHDIDEVAYESGIKYYRFDEIIDKYGDEVTTRNLLYRYTKEGTKKGFAIVIVSPKKSSIKVLEDELQNLKEIGVNFVFLSSINN